jgi:hypothetical protein
MLYKQVEAHDSIAIWPFHWLVSMPGALQASYISKDQFPRVFAWIQRFDNAIKEAKAAGQKPVRIKVEELIAHLSKSRFYEPVGEVDAQDPTAFKAGDEVTVWPLDSGTSHRDTGKLLSLTPNDIVIAKRTNVDDLEIHLHMPRWGFRIVKGTQGQGQL